MEKTIIWGKEKGFDWLAVILYPLAVILMETFWIYPWLVWIGLWPSFTESRPVLSLASVIVLLALSLVITRLLLRQSWSMRYIQAGVVGGGLVIIFLTLGVDYSSGYAFLSGDWFVYIGRSLWSTFVHPHAIVVAIPVMLYLWWRGINLGTSTSMFRSIYRTFLLGMVALILLIIVWRLSSGDRTFAGPGTDVGFYVMAFFFFGLMSVAICQLYTMRRSMPKEEAASASVWRWLPMMLGVIGGMVVVGFLVAGIFSPEFFAAIGRVVGAVGDFFGKIFDYILIPFNYVVEFIFLVVRWFLNLLRTGEPQELEMPEMGILGEEQPEVTGFNVPAFVTDIGRWLLILIVVAVIIYILAKAVSRIRAGRKLDEIEEIHESLWSLNTFRADLREFFNSLGSRFRRAPSPDAYRLVEQGRMNVRDIYKHLQWEASKSGMPRRRHETPDEYAKRLETWVPDGTDPLEGITDLYKRVRYGEVKVREKQVDRANSFWSNLKGVLQRFRGD